MSVLWAESEPRTRPWRDVGWMLLQVAVLFVPYAGVGFVVVAWMRGVG